MRRSQHRLVNVAAYTLLFLFEFLQRGTISMSSNVCTKDITVALEEGNHSFSLTSYSIWTTLRRRRRLTVRSRSGVVIVNIKAFCRESRGTILWKKRLRLKKNDLWVKNKVSRILIKVSVYFTKICILFAHKLKEFEDTLFPSFTKQSFKCFFKVYQQSQSFDSSPNTAFAFGHSKIRWASSTMGIVYWLDYKSRHLIPRQLNSFDLYPNSCLQLLLRAVC